MNSMHHIKYITRLLIVQNWLIHEFLYTFLQYLPTCDLTAVSQKVRRMDRTVVVHSFPFYLLSRSKLMCRYGLDPFHLHPVLYIDLSPGTAITNCTTSLNTGHFCATDTSTISLYSCLFHSLGAYLAIQIMTFCRQLKVP